MKLISSLYIYRKKENRYAYILGKRGGSMIGVCVWLRLLGVIAADTSEQKYQDCIVSFEGDWEEDDDEEEDN